MMALVKLTLANLSSLTFKSSIRRLLSFLTFSGVANNVLILALNSRFFSTCCSYLRADSF